MLQDYDTSFSRVYFSRPRLSSSPVPTVSPLSLPDPFLYIVSRSTCCQETEMNHSSDMRLTEAELPINGSMAHYATEAPAMRSYLS
ncbi:hypothetical protein TNCV_2374221 [Trichonephila clavipes]|nr:hypothetical protein TNCV_2374221 [Trichonephila clavipes]